MITKTSEYVSTGHPDKVADFISEYILDRIIEIDPNVRYALEVQIKDYVVNLGGEITTCADVDDYNFETWAREAVNKIGYTSEYAKNFGFDNTICGDRLEVNCYVSTQSPDIAQGVNRDAWGDQGIFFGFYCDESPDGDGIDHYLAKNLCQALYGMAKIGQGKVYGLDIKTQVTVSYIENKTPFVKEVIVAIPDQAGTEESRDAVKKMVDDFLTSAGAEKTKDYKCIVNGTGSYIKHSSVGDCGTTGRKLVVDFHGGRCRIGGGSPWTKDGTKADLTLNLYAHYLAKQEFEKGKGEYSSVETELSCCIGRPEVLVKIIYTVASDGSKLLKCEYTDIRPSSLIKEYKLDKPLYAERCMNGLFWNSDLYYVKKRGA